MNVKNLEELDEASIDIEKDRIFKEIEAQSYELKLINGTKTD